MQWRETSIITYSVYIGRSIPYCSTRKSCQGKNWGVAGEAAAKNRWTLPLKICIYPGMKKGCLRSIETSGDAMDDQMHMLRIH